ncbi:MAG TPA: hypothetical protein VGM18_17655 [Candidatus Sulfotelmatobacter sp.]|jgi:hypothetical protein
MLGLFMPGFALLLLSALAQAQLDVAVGGSTLMSTANTTASLNYLPPAEKAGTYPSISIEHIFTDRSFKGHNYGYNVEAAFRYHEGIYNNYQQYRPVLYDINAVYVDRLSKRAKLEFLAGPGGQRLLFYSPPGGCPYSSGCSTRFNSNQFLLHAGMEVHFRLWRSLFVRPEVHYYRIIDNSAFHSDNVLRLGASIGYTFRRDESGKD